MNSSEVTFIYIVLLPIKIVSKQLFSIKLENNVPVVQKDNSKHSIFSLRYFIMDFRDVIIQFSSNSICAIKSTILLEIKCPQ